MIPSLVFVISRNTEILTWRVASAWCDQSSILKHRNTETSHANVTGMAEDSPGSRSVSHDHPGTNAQRIRTLKECKRGWGSRATPSKWFQPNAETRSLRSKARSFGRNRGCVEYPRFILLENLGALRASAFRFP